MQRLFWVNAIFACASRKHANRCCLDTDGRRPRIRGAAINGLIYSVLRMCSLFVQRFGSGFAPAKIPLEHACREIDSALGADVLSDRPTSFPSKLANERDENEFSLASIRRRVAACHRASALFFSCAPRNCSRGRRGIRGSRARRDRRHRTEARAADPRRAYLAVRDGRCRARQVEHPERVGRPQLGPRRCSQRHRPRRRDAPDHSRRDRRRLPVRRPEPHRLLPRFGAVWAGAIRSAARRQFL